MTAKRDEESNGKDVAPALFLCGDVMTGRGLDQVLPHPNDPRLHEGFVKDARRYVELAERVNGEIRRPVALAYPWGDALTVLDEVKPAARIVNLETAITTSDDFWPGKGINYRMHPRNVGCLTAAGIDCCVLANNHVLDWGYDGLSETLQTLEGAGLPVAGAGRHETEAAAPAVTALPGGRRVLVFAVGHGSSGIPPRWAAAPNRAGVNLVPDLSVKNAERLARQIRSARRETDLVVVSIHWGGNWGYEIPAEQREFAHALVDLADVHVIHGHSAHHPRGIEVYRGRPILYGCGDFLNDYEGIAGHESFRGDLSLMYLVTVNPATGALLRLEMVPMQIRRFQLRRASEQDAEWLRGVMDRECARFGGRVEMTEGGRLMVR